MRRMTDMAKTTAEKIEDAMPVAMPDKQPDYPYGLCISLNEADLEKLGMDAECEVGDMLHGFFMAEVTSISKTQRDGQDTCRIERQITHLGVEDEDNESAEEAA